MKEVVFTLPTPEESQRLFLFLTFTDCPYSFVSSIPALRTHVPVFQDTVSGFFLVLFLSKEKKRKTSLPRIVLTFPFSQDIVSVFFLVLFLFQKKKYETIIIKSIILIAFCGGRRVTFGRGRRGG